MQKLLKIFQKLEDERIVPNSSYEVCITLMQKPDKDTKENKTMDNNPDKHRLQNSKKKNYQQSIQNQQHTNGIIHHDQIRFIPWKKGCFKTQNSINVMHYINRMKDKKDVKDRKVIGKEKAWS